MINLDAEKLEQTAAEAFSLARNSRRWQAAITKAWGILRDSAYWHMTADGALVILSPDSSELYEVTEGKCGRVEGERRIACQAFARSQPCKHRAARELADLISAVLRHPDLPSDLSEAIHDGLNDVFNDAGGELQRRVTESPEYVAALLTHCAGKGGAK